MSVQTAERRAEATSLTPPAVLPPMPPHWRSLPRAFVHAARKDPRRTAVSDSTKVSLNYGETFLRAAVLARVLGRSLGPHPYVGLLLPPTVASAVANLALALLGKVAVNLNYTASQGLIDSSIKQCGIEYVLSSPLALAKFGLKPKARVLNLEDLRAQVTAADKVIGAAVTKLVPIAALGAFLPGLRGDRPEATATVIFTSGSTGDPKGVVLTHGNILSNVHQMEERIKLAADESVLGVLPFFHSFGFTVEIWTVLCLGKRVVYHYNPLDARVVGDLCEKHGVTLLVGTPTFMRTYLKKCGPGKFKTLDKLLLGAEKVKPEFSREVRDALGIDPLEGYGCTEASPVIAVNVHHVLKTPDGRETPGNHIGTVGQPLPGTWVKTVDPETGLDLPAGETGEVVVKGPQVMAGYLNRPEATVKVLRDGWYATGDLGHIDADGFLRITDRLSRFSKIGGEMVPHLGLETALLEALGTAEPCVAVTAVPDPKRGERLFVLYTKEMGVPPAEAVRRLGAGSVAKLWIPSAEDFVEVEAIPTLGTGKVDLRRLKEIASEHRGG